MLKKLKAMKLVNMIPVKNSVSFDRTNMPGQSELEVSFNYDLQQPAEGSTMPDARKLQYSVLAREISETPSPLRIEMTIDYIFEVIDKDTLQSMEEVEIAEIAAFYCFLDIRRRFYNVMNTISLSGIKLPMSLGELS